MLQKIFDVRKLPNLRGQLAKKVTGTFGLKIASVGLAFINSILLARILGAGGYGLYSYAMTWIVLLGIPGSLGLTEIMVREVSIYQTKSEFSAMRGLVSWANRSVLLVSTVIGLLAAGIAWFYMKGNNPEGLNVFWLALLTLPLVSLTGLRRGTLQGLHKVVIGQIPEFLIQPVLFIGIVLGLYQFTKIDLSPTWIMGIRVLTVGVAFGVGTELLRRALPHETREIKPDYKIKNWTSSILPFLFITGTYFINNRTDILMLGILQGPETVGVYTVASRGADLITFILIAVNLSIGPMISSLYAAGDIAGLQRITTKSARMITLGSFPIGIILILFGKWFLAIFGSEFVVGYLALVILCCGQLLNAFVGSVGKLLNMTGYERDTAIAVGVSAVSNVILNAFLIPRFGTVGAAAATASSLVIWNTWLVVSVYKRLGIYATALGKMGSIKS